MVQITPAATALLESIDRPSGQVLRLEALDSQSLGLVMGEPVPDDLVLERGGTDLLHVSEAVSALLQDLVIDLVDTPDGPRLGLAAEPGQEGPEPDGLA